MHASISAPSLGELLTLLSPLSLALFVVSVPVVLLYVLKLRREERAVPSTLLWRRALEDVRSNVPWQRLQPNILLLLQLLILAALILSLAEPAYTHARSFNGDLVVVVDESYGMQPRDVNPSRFDAALAKAHALAADLGSGNVMSVIGMSDQPQLKIADSSDRGAIDRAIDSLHAGVAAPNFLRSLSLAASLARSGAQTRLVVLTSRDSGIAGLPISVPFQLEVVRIGGRLHDLGITAFQAVRQGGRIQALLRVSNFGASFASSDLNLYANGQLADVRPVSAAPGREQTLFWAHLPPATQSLQARLTRSDDVSGDKQAWSVVPAPASRRVLLVSSGDYFMQTALSLYPSVTLTSVRPDAYSTPRPGDFDLVVFDGWLPKNVPPAPVLLVAPSGHSFGSLHFGTRRLGGSVTPAQTASTGAVSSLLQYVDLSDVHVAWTRSVTLPDWMTPVAVSAGRTVVAAGDNGTIRLVIFSFNVQESDWPLRLSFPVIMQNIIHFLAPGLDLGTVQLSAGQPLKLFPGPGTREVQITQPNGRVDRLHPPLAPYTGTGQTGIYTVRANRSGQSAATAQFAVNFFPARIAPALGPDVLWLGRAQAGANTHTVSVPVSLSWAFYVAALGLLTAEWWFAFRR